MNKLRLVVFVVAFCALSSCATKESPQPEAPEAAAAPQGAQIANPASVNCEQKGGKLEIVEGPGGQQGICVLPDGTRCDEWAYFRGECP
jgi:putative hemolysin